MELQDYTGEKGEHLYSTSPVHTINLIDYALLVMSQYSDIPLSF